MTTEEKLSQLQFLVNKALITLENEKQALYSGEMNYLEERNELNRKLLIIAEMFLPEDENYVFNSVNQEQYNRLVRILDKKR